MELVHKPDVSVSQLALVLFAAAHDFTVHLLAAAPNASYLEAHGFGLDDFIAEPMKIRDGLAMAPERPGHGVEFDWKGLESLRRA